MERETVNVHSDNSTNTVTTSSTSSIKLRTIRYDDFTTFMKMENSSVPIGYIWML